MHTHTHIYIYIYIYTHTTHPPVRVDGAVRNSKGRWAHKATNGAFYCNYDIRCKDDHHPTCKCDRWEGKCTAATDNSCAR